MKAQATCGFALEFAALILLAAGLFAGDFGVGWMLDLKDLRLQTSRHLGRSHGAAGQVEETR